jgi:hypothetical protein
MQKSKHYVFIFHLLTLKPRHKKLQLIENVQQHPHDPYCCIHRNLILLTLNNKKVIKHQIFITLCHQASKIFFSICR